MILKVASDPSFWLDFAEEARIDDVAHETLKDGEVNLMNCHIASS